MDTSTSRLIQNRYGVLLKIAMRSKDSIRASSCILTVPHSIFPAIKFHRIFSDGRRFHVLLDRFHAAQRFSRCIRGASGLLGVFTEELCSIMVKLDGGIAMVEEVENDLEKLLEKFSRNSSAFNEHVASVVAAFLGHLRGGCLCNSASVNRFVALESLKEKNEKKYSGKSTSGVEGLNALLKQFLPRQLARMSVEVAQEFLGRFVCHVELSVRAKDGRVQYIDMSAMQEKNEPVDLWVDFGAEFSKRWRGSVADAPPPGSGARQKRVARYYGDCKDAKDIRLAALKESIV